MSKFYGVIGFVATTETSPGIWTETVTERFYKGDLVKNKRVLDSADKVNDDVGVSNSISIIGDPYANSNIYAMRYAVFANSKWKIENVEVQYPRLILNIGGLYNGQQT